MGEPYEKVLREIYLGIVFVILMAVAIFYKLPRQCKIFKYLASCFGYILGMILTNGVGSKLPSSLNSGILFSSKKILRFAITFYGFRITLSQIFDVVLRGFCSHQLWFSPLSSLVALQVQNFLVGQRYRYINSSGASVCGRRSCGNRTCFET